ncbi:hypothetical protein [Microbacterium sp. KR10-403]|uniref:hypothetical protein n=1 Tax=Microbacterium sp. KR10-403 TaxID=3158581 RepID=UPI0032E41AFD
MQLGQTSDPTALVPRSVAGIEAVVTAWQKRGDTASQIARALRRQAVPEGWAGDGADGLEARESEIAASRAP